MTTKTYKEEILIMMQVFNIPTSKLESLVKLHGGYDKYHAHLANIFDNRKVIRN